MSRNLLLCIDQDVALFLLRDGPFKVVDPGVSYEAFWKGVTVIVPNLARIALRLLSIAPTEAAVERAFGWSIIDYLPPFAINHKQGENVIP